MFEKINAIDTTAFWWINSHHCGVCDWVMWIASQAWSWAIVIIATSVVLLSRDKWKHWWVLLIGIALCFLLSDRISVMGFKEVVMRPRPCHALEGVRMFMTTCGGKYGFVSSHAANCFAIAVFLSMVSAQKWGQQITSNQSLMHTSHDSSLNNLHRPVLPYLLIIWALLVCYSRPYLGKHYPGDVICGALVGVGIGALVYFLYGKIIIKIAGSRHIND